MMRLFLKAGCLVVCLSASAAAWSGTVEDGLIQAFGRCDVSFFGYLKKHRADLQQYAPLEPASDVSRFATRKTENREAVRFEKPLLSAGLSFSGFSEYRLALLSDKVGDDLPSFYYWTLVIDNTTPEKAAALLKGYNWRRQSGNMVSAPEIITDTRSSSVWKSNSSVTGDSRPANNTAEKLLYLERGKNGSVNMTCTLQGYIPQKLLKSIRPDIGDS